MKLTAKNISSVVINHKYHALQIVLKSTLNQVDTPIPNPLTIFVITHLLQLSTNTLDV
jgi:hypothetical protein